MKIFVGYKVKGQTTANGSVPFRLSPPFSGSSGGEGFFGDDGGHRSPFSPGEGLEHIRGILLRLVGSQAVDFCPRDQLVGSLEGYDLVVSFGGDGTFLDLAGRVRSPDIPVLGVNSDPSTSVGFYCATDVHGFEPTLQAFMEGRIPQRNLIRIGLSINDGPPAQWALNDLLITHPNPGATCSYTIEAQGRSERQRSSGLWVSTPSGSSAAIRSAGGKPMPLGSKRLQFLVRELNRVWSESTPTLAHGFVASGEALNIGWADVRGAVYVDGPHRVVRVDRGDVLSVQANAPSLRVLVSSAVNS